MSGLVAVRRWPPGMKQWLHNCTLRRFDQRPVEIMYCPCPGFASLVSESRCHWVRFQLTGDAKPGRVSALRWDDVYHPGHTEPVGAHAEQVAPHLLLEWHGDGATLGELVPVAA